MKLKLDFVILAFVLFGLLCIRFLFFECNQVVAVNQEPGFLAKICNMIKADNVLGYSSICILGLSIIVVLLYKFGSHKFISGQIVKKGSWISIILMFVSLILTIYNYDNYFLGILIAAYFLLLTIFFEVLEKSKKSYYFFNKYERIQREYDNCIAADEAINNSLIEKHISKMLDSLIESISSLHPLLLNTKNNCDENSLKSFVNHIGSNSKNYLLLCCDNKDIYSKTFSNIYLNIFSKINEDFLSPLLPTGVEKHKFKAPEFLSNEISKALIMSDGFNSQYNTCTQSWEQFLDNINEPIKDTKSTTINRFRRLFICSEIPNTNDENLKKVVKWHNNNKWDIKYILDNEIPPYDLSVQSKDFSIITINNSSYILRITGEPIKEHIYNLQVSFYLIEISHSPKEVEIYNTLFKELWRNANEIKLSE